MLKIKLITMFYILSSDLYVQIISICVINPLTPELNAYAQRCLTRFCIGDFAS
jgi:hypothetical protein